MKITSVEFVKSVNNVEQIPKDGLNEIAFAGRSNVGKSSLINCLLNRKRLAKTSSTPGKTRQLNYFRINNNFYFVDLPGYGFAKVSKAEQSQWQRLLEGYLRSNPRLRGVISIIDSRIGPTELDKQLLEWLKSLGIHTLVVATKSDKLSKGALKNQIKKFYQEIESYIKTSIFSFSAVTGMGKKELWREILTLLE